jgi:ABC-type antimicrobial peptide transport system permease subunit
MIARAKPVAIINQTLATQLFPNENAVGKRFGPGGNEWMEVIGVAEDGKYNSLSDGPTPVVFYPIQQQYNSTCTVVARSSLPADRVVRMIEQTVHDMDRSMPFYQADSLEDHLRLPLLPARLAASMLVAFGALALVLAATGVYGVMAYAVARRRREIGIRMAIGATRAQVMRLVLRRTAVLLSVGTLLGTLVALAAGNLFSPILYGISPRDPVTFALAVLLMGAVAMAAGWFPARRAMSTDPASALRDE